MSTFKTVLRLSTVLGITACSVSSVSAQPDIYKVEYQFCIPQEVLATLPYQPFGKNQSCTRTGTSYVWANEPPVAKLFWSYNPGKRQSNSINYDRYETRIKSLGCANGSNGPQQLGWYMGRVSPSIDDRFTKETPELEMTYTVEKVKASGGGSSILMPGMQGCQLRQAIQE